jgi:hypothetical protein
MGLAGRFDVAERLARASFRLAEHAAAPDADAHFAAQLASIRREQGRLHELVREIERLAHGGPEAAVWRSVLPLAHLDAGDLTRARAAYDDALGGGAAARSRSLLWLTATGALCEAAVELGDAEAATRLYAELEPYADRFIQWSFTGNAGSVQRLLARAAAAAGWRDRAREHFETALTRHAELVAPALLARTRCDFAEFLLQGTGAERPAARRLLRASGEHARRLGMAGVASRAADLEARGPRRCWY